MLLKLNFPHTGQAVEERQVLGTSDNTHDACPESGDHMGTRGCGHQHLVRGLQSPSMYPWHTEYPNKKSDYPVKAYVKKSRPSQEERHVFQAQ